MGNTSTKDVRAAGLALLAATLGAGWQKAEWATNLDKNALDFKDKTFALVAMEAPKAAVQALRTLTFDQAFSVILCAQAATDSGDADLLAASDALFGLLVDCFVALVQNKFGAPPSAGVLNVGDPAMSSPLYKAEKGYLLVEGTITVTWKTNY